jgi:hypothetical protein
LRVLAFVVVTAGAVLLATPDDQSKAAVHATS